MPTTKNDGRLTPVFVAGCDRSGTTMLGSMLGGHSECLTVPESTFKINVPRRMGLDALDPNNTRILFNAILDDWRLRVWGLDVEQLRRESVKAGLPYSQAIEQLVCRYAERMGESPPRYWVDHTPQNRRDGIQLLQLFPGAPVIHVVRDGRAVAASMIAKDGGPNTVRSAATKWQKAIADGLALESWLGQEKVIRIRYEDLVTQPKETLGCLCAFLNLDFQQEMVTGEGYRVPEYDQAYHGRIGKQPDASRINAWQEALSTREIEIFEWSAGHLLQYLGYSLQNGWPGRGPTLTETARMMVIEAFRSIVNRFRKRKRRWLTT